MTALSVLSLVYYLTTAGEFGPAWRDQDWIANKIIKCVKGEPIRGYLDLRIDGKDRRFDEQNRDELLDIVCRRAAQRLQRLPQRRICVVPVPNSGATVRSTTLFRTAELAEKIVSHGGAKLEMLPALRWRRAMTPAHKGGTRDPGILFENLSLQAKPDGPVVLFDDVMTSGGHMIASYRRLVAEARVPVAALVIGRATQIQHEKMLGWQEEALVVDEGLFDFDF